MVRHDEDRESRRDRKRAAVDISGGMKVMLWRTRDSGYTLLRCKGEKELTGCALPTSLVR